MKKPSSRWIATAIGLWCVWSSEAAARACTASLTRENVVQCALAASALSRAEREGALAREGRQRALGPPLPSNPVLSLSGARRVAGQQQATNWYGQLSQEVEVAGQRGARQRALTAERRAQASVVGVVEREVAAAALRSYFEVLAARAALELAERMERAFGSTTVAARAAAERGVSAGLDADLADLTSVRLGQARVEASRRFASASAELTTLVGRDPSTTLVRVEGELTPLSDVDVVASELTRRATDTRPEIAVAEATHAALEGWAEAYRRARIPNVTLSIFAQRDGFSERVLGGGLSLPLPLPGSFGRNFSGEAAEHSALARQAAAQREQAQRDVRLEVARALQALQAAREQYALFSEERVTRAEHSLTAIARAIAEGKLAFSNAVVPQQALFEFLNQQVVAKLALCLASVELTRAAGLSLAGDPP